MSCTEINVEVIGNASALGDIIDTVDNAVQDIKDTKTEIDSLKESIDLVNETIESNANAIKESVTLASTYATKAAASEKEAKDTLDSINNINAGINTTYNNVNNLAKKVENIYKSPIPIKILNNAQAIGDLVTSIDFIGSNVQVSKATDNYYSVSIDNTANLNIISTVSATDKKLNFFMLKNDTVIAKSVVDLSIITAANENTNTIYYGLSPDKNISDDTILLGSIKNVSLAAGSTLTLSNSDSATGYIYAFIPNEAGDIKGFILNDKFYQCESSQHTVQSIAGKLFISYATINSPSVTLELV